MKLGEAIKSYIDSRTYISSPETISGYRNLLARHFTDLLMRDIDDIKSIDIQIALNSESVKYSEKTLRNAYGLLTAAVYMFYPDRRFVVTLPPKSKQKKYIPNDAEFVNLVRSCTDPQLRFSILLAGTCGLRRGEICALTKNDCIGHKIYINKSMAYQDNLPIIKCPKTFESNRIISAPEIVFSALSFFPEGNTLIGLTPKALTSRFGRFVSHAYGLHALRHYHASVMLKIGVPDKYAMQRMGHATQSILHDVYQHVFDDAYADQELMINNYYDAIIL